MGETMKHETGMEKPDKRRRHRKKGLGLSRSEFAIEIDTPLSDVNAMIAEGQIKVIKLGKLERIPRSEAAKPKTMLNDEGTH